MNIKGIFTDRENVLYQYTVFLKWLIIAAAAGIVIGAAGSLFHISLDFAADFRNSHSYMLYLLPLGGVLTVLLYDISGMSADSGTNAIISGARGEKRISVKTAPLIVITTFITHILGGSAGREGAALQLGGSLVSPLRKPLFLNKDDYSILIMCGMAAGFSSLFGTPASAAVFAIEVTVVGMARYSALVPCLISSLTAAMVSSAFGLDHTSYSVKSVPTFDLYAADTLAVTVVIGIGGAIVSIIFCKALTVSAALYRQFFSNPYIRAAAGGLFVVIISSVIFGFTGAYDYNGAGTDIIAAAFKGDCRPEAFILKLILTALTIGAGFRGGEIVPTLFIGSTFGCLMGGLCGSSPSLGAALGLAAVFCGVTNCPLATLILSIELFGTESLPYYALAAGISYMLSGYTGLYSSQKFIDNKFIHARFHHLTTYSEIKEHSKENVKEK